MVYIKIVSQSQILSHVITDIYIASIRSRYALILINCNGCIAGHCTR